MNITVTYFASAMADQGLTGTRTLKGLATSIGSSKQATIVLSHTSSGNTTTYSMSQSVTLTSNITLKIEKGAVLSIAAGKTLTINGTLDAGEYQIFSGEGTVTFTGIDRAYPEWRGATGDGVTDDQAAMQLLANDLVDTDIIYSTLANKVYYIGSQLSLRYVRKLDLQGRILVGFTGSAGVIIGDNATHVHTDQKFISAVTNSDQSLPVDPLIRVVGAKSQNITIGLCQYVQLWASSSATEDNSSAYNRFFLDSVSKFEINGDGADSWINENFIKGGRMKYLSLLGPNAIGVDNNRFEDSVLEASTVIITYGTNNRIDGRFEGTSTISFGADTRYNTITQTYAGIRSYPLHVNPTVTDLGYGNIVNNQRAANMQRYPLLTLASNTVNILDNSADVNVSNVYAGLGKLKVIANSTELWSSDLIPVYPGSYIQFSSDAALWIAGIYLYDSTGTLITSETDPGYAVCGAMAWLGSSWYRSSVSSDRASAVISSPAVAFIKIRILSGSASANEWFRYASVEIWNKKIQDTIQKSYFSENGKRKIPSSAASPTTGFAQVGDIVSKTDGASIYICTFALDTTLAEDVAASETANISVTSLIDVVAGDIVGILLDDGSTYWDTVADVTGGDLTLTGAGPASVSSSGNRIVFNRWATH